MLLNMRAPNPTVTAPDPWLRVEEAAELLKVSTRTIYKLVNSGELPASRVGSKWRIRRVDVLNFGAGE